MDDLAEVDPGRKWRLMTRWSALLCIVSLAIEIVSNGITQHIDKDSSLLTALFCGTKLAGYCVAPVILLSIGPRRNPSDIEFVAPYFLAIPLWLVTVIPASFIVVFEYTYANAIHADAYHIVIVNMYLMIVLLLLLKAYRGFKHADGLQWLLLTPIVLSNIWWISIPIIMFRRQYLYYHFDYRSFNLLVGLICTATYSLGFVKWWRAVRHAMAIEQATKAENEKN